MGNLNFQNMYKVLVSAFMFFLMSLPALAFTDVADDAFYANSITFLGDQGIVEGYADGSFGYDKEINRAEMLKILIEARVMKMEDENLEGFADKNCFDDVKAGEWYTKYVCFAKYHGFVSGYGDNTFRPNDKINFVEGVKMLITINGVAHFDESEFPDVPWYFVYVYSAGQANTIPWTITSFNQKLTRAEMADMVARQYHHDMGDLEEFLDLQSMMSASYYSIDRGVDLKELSMKSDEEGAGYVLFKPVEGSATDYAVPEIDMGFELDKKHNLYWNYNYEELTIMKKTSGKIELPYGDGYLAYPHISLAGVYEDLDAIVAELSQYENVIESTDEKIGKKKYKKVVYTSFGNTKIYNYYIQMDDRFAPPDGKKIYHFQATENDLDMLKDLMKTVVYY